MVEAQLWCIVHDGVGQDLHFRAERLVGFGLVDFLVLFGGQAVLPGHPGKAGFKTFVHKAEKADGWHRVRGENFSRVVLGEAFGELVDPLLCELRRDMFHPGVLLLLGVGRGFFGSKPAGF